MLQAILTIVALILLIGVTVWRSFARDIVLSYFGLRPPVAHITADPGGVPSKWSDGDW